MRNTEQDSNTTTHLLARFASLIKSKSYKYFFGGILSLLVIVILGASVVVPWIEIPASSNKPNTQPHFEIYEIQDKYPFDSRKDLADLEPKDERIGIKFSTDDVSPLIIESHVAKTINFGLPELIYTISFKRENLRDTPAEISDLARSDIIVGIGGIPIDATTMTLDDVDIVYRRAVANSKNGDVIFQVVRYGETYNLPVPKPELDGTTGPTELNFPYPDVAISDLGLSLTRIDNTPYNREGTELSLMGIWLGGNEDVPTLDLRRAVHRESGFSAVRGADRFLIVIPLLAIAILCLAALTIMERISAIRAFGYITLLSLILFATPFVWQLLSAQSWRGYLVDITADETRRRDVYVLNSEIIRIYNMDTDIILEEITEDTENDPFTDFQEIDEEETATAVEDSEVATDTTGGSTLTKNREPFATSIIDSTMDQLLVIYRNDFISISTFILFLVSGMAWLIMLLEAKGVFRNRDRLVAVLMLTPSIVLIGIFVYVFIFQTIQFSATNWGENNARPPLSEDIDKTYTGLQNYKDLMTDINEYKFRASLVNTMFFTIFFLVACVALGFLMAIILDRGVFGEGIFRTIFLFPMALSFVVTGTVWGWILQPRGGINRLLGLDSTNFRWISSTNVVLQFTWDTIPLVLTIIGSTVVAYAVFSFILRQRQTQNEDFQSGNLVFWGVFGFFWLLYFGGFWDGIFPPLQNAEQEIFSGGHGYRAALSGVLIAAVWQMSGYTMALFLAGIRGIPEELREAAYVDGCSEWQVYRYIIIPLLRPVTLTAFIILGHISLKIFDLVFAISGNPDNPNVIVPGLLVYTEAFRGNRFATGSAIGVIMLFLVSLVIIPYLWSTLREEGKTK